VRMNEIHYASAGKSDPVRPASFRAGRFDFPLNRRTYIMGILNVTPDSFSDGGRFFNMDQALRHAAEMLEHGADILDIGGESTRPGFTPVSIDEELQRVIPIIEKIYRTFNCPVSIDTCKAVVADAALTAGACIANDINGLQQDPDMAAVVLRHHAGVVIMHNARLYRDESVAETTGDLMTEVAAFLRKSCQLADEAGLKSDQLLIDPGIGFGVTPMESIQMIARLGELKTLGLPILLAPSRKRFISHILGEVSGGRLHGTSAAVAIGIARGADFVRVHDVREMAEVVRVADALCR
jgi:dihydropteroate synthase